jgi:hypothetical protein
MESTSQEKQNNGRLFHLLLKIFCDWCPVRTLGSPLIVASNSKSDAIIRVKFRNPLPSSMLRFASRGGTFFKPVLYPPSSCAFLLASLLITTDAALQIIKSSPELDIVDQHYSSNRPNVSEKRFWSVHRVSVNIVHKHCQKHSSRTMFSKFCSQTLFIHVCTHTYTRICISTYLRGLFKFVPEVFF